MAYLEIRKGENLVKRREIDNDKARRGCRIRLGSLGSVHIKVGQTATLGNFEIKLIEDISESANTQEPSLNGQDINVLTFSHAGEAKPGRKSVKEQYGNSGYPGIEGYEIIDQLGEGGMGTVWRAIQLGTKRHVALKLLGNRYFTSKSAQARFEREVSLSAKLTHPNIARIYDSGLHEGIYYYVMELLEGQHLDKYVLEEDLDQCEILALIAKVSMAVEYAHTEGIVHRDLKPSNIIVTPDGEPHILDFGLAKTLEKDSGDITLSIEGQITGTLSYMSPEQAKGDTKAVAEQTDIYSLGIILYQLLTGTLPHDMHGSRLEILKRIAEQEVINPRFVSNKINRDIEAILLKALALDPYERYLSMTEFTQEIENYLAGKPVTARNLSTIYVLRKSIRHYRHKILSTVYLSLALMAAIGAIWFLLFRYFNIRNAVNWYNERLSNQEQNKQISSKHKNYIEEGQRQNQNKIGQQNPLKREDFIPKFNLQVYKRGDKTFYREGKMRMTQKERQKLEVANLIDKIRDLVGMGQWRDAQILVETLDEGYSDTIAYEYDIETIKNLKSIIESNLNNNSDFMPDLVIKDLY